MAGVAVKHSLASTDVVINQSAVMNFSWPFPRCCTSGCWRHRLWIVFLIFH